MLCLGIETSCDDTSLALVADAEILGVETWSQNDLHALFGGVVPELASREHAKNIGGLFDRLLERTGVRAEDIELVSPARGPGLLGSLLVGVAFAKAFALGSGVRFIGINHLHAHVFAAGLKNRLSLPALALLVSGGHTLLYRVEGPDKFTVLGKSSDDAAGEAFDKAGKMLGLPYPAGRHIDRLAQDGVVQAGLFPRPHTGKDNLDFSFSGLKTAMWLHVSRHPELRASFDVQNGELSLPQNRQTRQCLADTCASYRQAVVDCLCLRVEQTLSRRENADMQSIILAGGVAANSLLRLSVGRIAAERGLECNVPPLELCADNGAMIAYLGLLLADMGYEHGLGMRAVPRGTPVPQDMLRSRQGGYCSKKEAQMVGLPDGKTIL
ncbi:MAG: tRNA (adenosine(37)-N6)-threonylcarbamoyltransferase complex transferase subunit TsaD [Desulfovibrio sp.]|jgi:N6-L-threonylcarbamoyladenine synthase|nr:tRNA (adenosine(37)-N6)-threonylcarbamoyltransferase complex transferase subunit TsaD [Desulfovibrio sp.]